jgi:hypothetical protein
MGRPVGLVVKPETYLVHAPVGDKRERHFFRLVCFGNDLFAQRNPAEIAGILLQGGYYSVGEWALDLLNNRYMFVASGLIVSLDISNRTVVCAPTFGSSFNYGIREDKKSFPISPVSLSSSIQEEYGLDRSDVWFLVVEIGNEKEVVPRVILAEDSVSYKGRSVSYGSLAGAEAFTPQKIQQLVGEENFRFGDANCFTLLSPPTVPTLFCVEQQFLVALPVHSGGIRFVPVHAEASLQEQLGTIAVGEMGVQLIVSQKPSASA